MNDPYGSARRDLELLRRELWAQNTGIRFPRQSNSAARIGEYRFILPGGQSVYVQGPLTPSGRWRRHGWSWRYNFEGQRCCFKTRRGIIASIVTVAMNAPLRGAASQLPASLADPRGHNGRQVPSCSNPHEDSPSEP